jgi:hypothetical protein
MTNGQAGEYPEGYSVAQAARYWRISPDQASKLCVFWIELAGVISTAEAEVQKKKEPKTPTRFGRRR